MWAKIELERLFYIRREQGRLRADSYSTLKDTFTAGDGDPTNVGQRVILPSSFTGSPRYMFERQQDAMSYVRKYGKPDLFVTMTTNPKWREITDNLFEGQQAHDRPDLIVRVFKLKLQRLMVMLKIKNGFFGDLQARLYSIEFQKRGLPHAHILLWLSRASKIQSENFDRAVRAEIPCQHEDPELFEIVTTNMIHGPCGDLNPTSPCMKNRVCSKGFPKPFLQHTETGIDSYPKYRRRHPQNGGRTATLQRNGCTVKVDNRWVVPYNAFLIRQMNCHFNVELCSSVKSIKYVLKYVHKGSDQATFKVTGQDTRDEVSDFINARYIGSTEAAWRIFQMPMNERYPVVIQLAVHLENVQRVYFTEENAQEKAAADPPVSTLTAFFQLRRTDEFAASLLYENVPKFFTWNNKSWNRRKRGKVQNDVFEANIIGRMYTVSPRQGECFFLRLLLHHVRGPTSFNDLKTVDGELCLTYRDACLRRGLLEDDNIHHRTLEEASLSISAQQMRRLFSVILLHCNPSNPMDLWLRHSTSMAEDLAHSLHLDVTDPIIIQRALKELEDMVLEMGGNELGMYGLPTPDRDIIERAGVDYRRETSYDRNQEQLFSNNNLRLMNAEQRAVHDEFTRAALNNHGGIYFLDAPGGCGKTFLIHTILATIRAHGKIVISTASSGLAATLLTGGRTIHSTFKVPLNLTQSDVPLCSIKKGTSLARLLKDCSAIVVDEAPMSHKLDYEAMDRSISDITGINRPMGGITTLLCGDFRQILPVVRGGTRSNIVNACLKSSHLWQNIITRHLRTNMRVQLCGDEEAGQFANLLLKIGGGSHPLIQDPDIISIDGLGSHVATTGELIDAVFPDFLTKHSDAEWLSERAILAPLNETVASINLKMMQMMPGECKTYSSYDATLTDEEAVLFPTKFLNSIDVAGLPSHRLHIKIGMPVMIMRSLNPPRLMNRTRCTVTRFTANTVIMNISSGPYKGETHCIPRISLQPSDTTLPFTFSR